MTRESPPTLTVVVVTRNEAAHVAECLDSVFELCSDGPATEVILVDSNSSDESVEIATEFPATVLRIPSDELASPGAGRHVGTKYATGEYILFVDGDMKMETGWLDAALEAIEDPNVVGVSGHLNSVSEPGITSQVEALRGVALYDREALESVGGFDPYLQASEDRDVGYRLTAQGYRLVQIPYVVAHHQPANHIGEPLRRWRQGYFHGVGQAVRKATDDPRVLGRHLFSLRHAILVVGWVALGLVLLGSGTSRRTTLTWAGLSVLGAGGYVARTGPEELVVDSCSYFLTVVGLVLGALGRQTPADAYPLCRVEVVKRADPPA